MRREYFEPLFDFSYPLNTESGVRDTSRFTTTELRLSVQFAPDEQFIQRDNRRISMGARRWPIFRAQYSLGLNNVLGSDFSYQKLKLTISQNLNVGVLGTSKYILEGGYIFSQLPYPLLEVHLGNSSPFYYRQGFNTMNRAEFISDHYAAFALHPSLRGLLPQPRPPAAQAGMATHNLSQRALRRSTRRKQSLSNRRRTASTRFRLHSRPSALRGSRATVLRTSFTSSDWKPITG